ncbi:hypothetical protein M0802_009450 [Mischocyttarus mexicanus]|nr:hypothetical protein M0802_009450 [Mischocyttarus mexicanus]
MTEQINSVNQNGRRQIRNSTYSSVPQIPGSWKPEKGLYIRPLEKFEVPTQFNKISPKVYSALCDRGLKKLADEALKHKHRSMVNSTLISDTIKPYSKHTPPCLVRPAFYKALQKLRATLNVTDKLRPLTLEEAAQNVPPRASPGLPYIITHEGYTNRDIIETCFDEIKEFWDRYREVQHGIIPDCAAIARSKICSVDVNEVRPTWAMPICVILQEARFAVPLLKALEEQKCCTNAGYGCEILKGGMMWLNNEISICKKRYGPIKMLIPKYDDFNARVPAWLIREVFNIVKEKFHLTVGDDSQFQKCISYFTSTSIRDPEGRRFFKTHGIPIGSMFTDIIGTLIHMVITWIATEELYNEYPLLEFFFSDNNVICYRENMDIDVIDYAKYMYRVFGLTINCRESYWTDDIKKVNLHGYYNHYGMPYKDVNEIIAMMLYSQELKDVPESWESVVSKVLDCMIISAGCNSDVSNACKAIANHATRKGVNMDAAINITRTIPRSLRHRITLGFQDLHIIQKFLFNYNCVVPDQSCNKFKSNIHLT